MKPAKFAYQRARDVADALAALAGGDEDTRVIAGGQSLGPMLNLRVVRPSLLVDIGAVAELAAIDVGDEIVIGAGVTHARIEDGAAGDGTNGLLAHAAAGIAYRAVRNRGTIGGSLAHADPAGDWAPLILALGGTVEVRGRERRTLAVSELIAAPLSTTLARDEIISAIRLPRLGPRARWGHVKFTRKPGDFADSLAVAVLDPDRATQRVILGSRNRIPMSLGATQRCLGTRAAGAPDWAMLESAAEEDLRSAAEFGAYERALHKTIVLRALKQAMA